VATGELPLHCDAIVTEFPQGLAPFTFPKVHADRFGGKRAPVDVTRACPVGNICVLALAVGGAK